jgi:hypothetical protein
MSVSEKLGQVLTRAFVPGERFDDLTIEVRTVGELLVSSGKIVACDSLVCPQTTPFTKAVPSGSHPVLISTRGSRMRTNASPARC